MCPRLCSNPVFTGLRKPLHMPLLLGADALLSYISSLLPPQPELRSIAEMVLAERSINAPRVVPPVDVVPPSVTTDDARSLPFGSLPPSSSSSHLSFTDCTLLRRVASDSLGSAMPSASRGSVMYPDRGASLYSLERDNRRAGRGCGPGGWRRHVGSTAARKQARPAISAHEEHVCPSSPQQEYAPGWYKEAR
jgi:hypothetical protein